MNTGLTDIHDIRPPLMWGMNPLWEQYGLFILAGILVLCGLIWAFWQWRRWRNKTLEIETIFPELAPEDWARQQLDHLRGLMDTHPKAYYFGLSEILRGYLEKRFSLEALEMTSEELIPRLVDLKLDPEWTRQTKAFLLQSDLVKFAGVAISSQGMETHDQWVRKFVEITTPVVMTTSLEISSQGPGNSTGGSIAPISVDG
ncbi:MAG: DUF4381 domain-containing protein [Proteobacteria bacterium]|nr:DUF4381 domain-containing protein [Pseudomonadota bacterium]MBU4469639.1 DUF4381 domain-containing protein [Pseudomonadota bacterium]MCG2751722.1 DUF4381 domain-containing protein [Desulfobacteraceae bacterium]